MIPDNLAAFLAEHTPPESGAPRSESFEFAFEHFVREGGRTLVELGTIRSFVHGGLPGCDEDDTTWWQPDAPETWDWGAGCFSLTAALCLGHLQPAIHTVDVATSHIDRCRVVTARFSSLFHYHVADSVVFLESLRPRSVDLVYLDTGDVWPMEPSARHQLHEVETLCRRSVLRERGLVLIDDVRSPVPRQFGSATELGKATPPSTTATTSAPSGPTAPGRDGETASSAPMSCWSPTRARSPGSSFGIWTSFAACW